MAATQTHPATRQTTDWGMIALLALTFSLVGIDRFMINTMFPAIQKDLGLDYTDIGIITGALAFAWGFASLIMGNKADHWGRGKVLVGSMLVFSLLIGASGLAAGLFSLIMVRVVMGFADGAFTPASIATTIDSASERHHGLAIGTQQMLLPLIGLGLTPILVTQLLHVVDWRWIFAIFSIPGFILTWLMWRKFKSIEALQAASASTPAEQSLSDEAEPEQSNSIFSDWKKVLAYRNILLAMGLMLCWLTTLTTASALLPSYLIDYIGLKDTQMGGVMSAIGLGAALGCISLLWLSDITGRKPILLLASLGGIGALFLLKSTGNEPTMLFLWLFFVNFFNNAAITITVGPLCAETVSPKLMATASGVVIAAGEFFGGGLAPIIAGQVATVFGIDKILLLPIGALGLAFLISLFIIETKPRT